MTGKGYLDVGTQVGGPLLADDCQKLVAALLHRLIPFLDTVNTSECTSMHTCRLVAHTAWGYKCD